MIGKRGGSIWARLSCNSSTFSINQPKVALRLKQGLTLTFVPENPIQKTFTSNDVVEKFQGAFYHRGFVEQWHDLSKQSFNQSCKVLLCCGKRWRGRSVQYILMSDPANIYFEYRTIVTLLHKEVQITQEWIRQQQHSPIPFEPGRPPSLPLDQTLSTIPFSSKISKLAQTPICVCFTSHWPVKPKICSRI